MAMYRMCSFICVTFTCGDMCDTCARCDVLFNQFVVCACVYACVCACACGCGCGWVCVCVMYVCRCRADREGPATIARVRAGFWGLGFRLGFSFVFGV